MLGDYGLISGCCHSALLYFTCYFMFVFILRALALAMKMVLLLVVDEERILFYFFKYSQARSAEFLLLLLLFPYPFHVIVWCCGASRERQCSKSATMSQPICGLPVIGGMQEGIVSPLDALILWPGRICRGTSRWCWC